MSIPDSSELEDGVVVKRQYRDATDVAEALNLSGEPLWVGMNGRTVIFAYPTKDNND